VRCLGGGAARPQSAGLTFQRWVDRDLDKPGQLQDPERLPDPGATGDCKSVLTRTVLQVVLVARDGYDEFAPWQAGRMTTREQPWSDDGPAAGRVVLLTRNPIAEAIESIATTVGRPVTVLAEDSDGQGVAALAGFGLREGDAVVLCDHDAPDAPQVLRDALASTASYVAMMASRRRSEGLLEELEREGVPGLDKLHVPAGLNTGGKAPGEIALSVVAELVACSYGRGGGPMGRR
jgi:xanthine dehydrogenase accessory factor